MPAIIEPNGLGGFVVAVTGINPEPWEIGKAYVARGGGRSYARISPSQRLVEYQEALRHEVLLVAANDPDVKSIMEGNFKQLEVGFIFRRKLEEGVSKAGRRRYGKPVDATNLQKGSEDALQGVLYGNDRDNVRVYSEIEQQSRDVAEPVIIITVHPALETDSSSEYVSKMAEKANAHHANERKAAIGESDNEW